MNFERKKLGEIASFINGKAFKPEEWKLEGLPIIRIQNLTNLDKEFNYFDGKIENKYLVKNGDVLISWSATLDVFEWNRGDAVLNQHIFKVVFDKVEVNKNFFKYLIKTKIKEIENYSHGATMKHIVKDDFYNISVLFPILEEQKKIAEILDTADEIRQKDKAIIAKYNELSQSLFLDMFGDPINNPFAFPISELKQIILDVTNGISRRRKEMENMGDIVLRLRDIKVNNIDFTDLNRIPLENKERVKYKIDIDDLLFIRVNGNKDYVGRCAIFKNYNENIYFNDHIMRVKVKHNQLNPIFLSFFLNSKYGKSEIKNHIKTSAGQFTISQSGLEKIKIILPPIELQNQFSDRLELIEKQKELAEKSLKKSEELFNSLLDKAFKGEL